MPKELNQPIVFTSIRDDSYPQTPLNGDTNNDGNATLPLPDDWLDIVISGNANLDWLKLRYGSANPLSIQPGANVTQGPNIFIEP